jgi:hypothetical protein
MRGPELVRGGHEQGEPVIVPAAVEDDHLRLLRFFQS